jgi:hypothetical protein
VVANPTASDPNALQTLVATSSSGAASVGVFLALDDRAASTRNDTEVFIVNNGAANVINDVAANDTVTSAAWHMLTWKLDDDGGAGTDTAVFADGAQIDSVARGAPAYSAAAPAAALTIGASGTSTLRLTGDIAQVMLVQTADATTRTQVESFITCTYGGMPQ